MEFLPSGDTDLIRQTVRDFAEKHIRPHIMEWDESQTFP
jgi:alkylation response protein AidB-like acyl-CoA dehydrogenase